MTRMLMGFLLASVLLTSASHAFESSTELSKYRKHVYAWLLTADDPFRVRLGARNIEHDGHGDVELTDMVAKVLWEFNQGGRELGPDTAAWFARALGATHSKRYQHLLEEVAAKNPGKVAKYAKLSMEALSDPGSDFDPATVQLNEIRTSLIKEQEQALPTEASLYDVQPGVWIEDVFEKFGYPSDVNLATHQQSIHVGRVTISNMMLVYANKGVIEFARSHGDWYATAVAPRSVSEREANGESGHPAGQPKDDISRGLLSPDPAVFRATARRAFQMKLSDEPTLDIAAWRLQEGMNSENSTLIDGLAYTCLMIGNSRNPRYRDWLINISRNARKGKLRRHAQDALESIPDAQVEQFTGRSPASQLVQ